MDLTFFGVVLWLSSLVAVALAGYMIGFHQGEQYGHKVAEVEKEIARVAGEVMKIIVRGPGP